MLTYRYVSLAFVLISGFLITGYFAFDITLVYLIIVIAIYLLMCFIGSVFICLDFYTKAICRGVQSEGKSIFITFDDSPDKEETPLVLEVLKKHDVKATFFIVGEKAEKDPGLIEKISASGHVLGNHSYGHGNLFPLKSKRKIVEEINKTNSIIESVKPSGVNIFRPPFGVTNPLIAKAIKKSDVYTIGWSLKSLDTVIKDHDRLLERLAGKTKPGDVVLLHDTVKNIHMVVDKYIEFLKKNNYNFETVDKLIIEQNTDLPVE